ncbi:hypothetical protein OG609_44055 [Streptomyces sp. NBC_01224]|uniref:hypothetical protein n=1 Tax=Streptomyces sp. NBC_01224 TaxID=2903783 RepID=UPI002E0EDF65|nr:hypothetical protein OG609_44055 [Streptomyces sp. NBC_01224]
MLNLELVQQFGDPACLRASRHGGPEPPLPWLSSAIVEATADGPQPTGYADFADGALISVDEDGTATLGSSPMSMCGDATVEATEGSDGKGQSFRIEFPKHSSCVTVEVPNSLDVVVDGDSMTATPTGSTNAHFSFRRAG